MQNTIYGGDGGEALETQQTITNGGRAKVAGASRLRTSDKWPRLPVASRARLGAFRPKRPEVSRDETRERNAEDDPVRVPVSLSRVTGPEPTAPDPASRTVHDRLSSRSTSRRSLNTPSETRSLRKKKPKRHAGYGDRVEASPFATESDAPPQPFADSPRLHKNKNSKFDVGTAKVGAGGFDAQRSRFDYETAQAAAAQMKARQLGGAGSFLSHD